MARQCGRVRCDITPIRMGWRLDRAMRGETKTRQAWGIPMAMSEADHFRRVNVLEHPPADATPVRVSRRAASRAPLIVEAHVEPVAYCHALRPFVAIRLIWALRITVTLNPLPMVLSAIVAAP